MLNVSIDQCLFQSQFSKAAKEKKVKSLVLPPWKKGAPSSKGLGPLEEDKEEERFFITCQWG